MRSAALEYPSQHKPPLYARTQNNLLTAASPLLWTTPGCACVGRPLFRIAGKQRRIVLTRGQQLVVSSGQAARSAEDERVSCSRSLAAQIARECADLKGCASPLCLTEPRPTHPVSALV